ncbi:MAG: YybH family protein [Candidatus Kariarchaeaceae archaeon]|jgi:uncharacterized protein (TIGR02246 family)
MNNRIYVLLVFALGVVIALFGCQQESEEQADSGEQEDSEMISVEADVEALKEEIRKYDDTYSSGNLDGYVALFANDAVQMPYDAPIIVGKDAIHSEAKEFFANNTLKLTDTVEDTKVSGDWAIVRGRYTDVITPNDGSAVETAEGKWVVIYQRQSDGSWKINTEIWNLDAPSQ